ncbi:unnamed protein product [Echinostoma caproni]|uniref:DUF667 domain-containing protein n=1 Tax=Echinostoma caproni TaxID=27848 RepID=A0A183AB16_9TREM|nr:unnamed protein product [Echinostoma caproni]
MVELASRNLLLPLESDWVEKEERGGPANYLLDTGNLKILNSASPCFQEIFYKLRGNSFVQADPNEVHFHITENRNSCKKPYKRRLYLINVATKSTRVNFIPPETKWFKLFYSVPKPFVPGSRISCTVTFEPDKTRYYEDVIRVHTEVLAFEALIRQDANEERRNQVRWQAKTGQQPISAGKREQIRREWESAWQNHLNQCTNLESVLQKPIIKYPELIRRNEDNNSVQPRPHRPAQASSNLTVTPSFRTRRLPTDGWTKRWDRLNRFRHAVSKLIIRQRMTGRLKMIKNQIHVKSINEENDGSEEELIIPEDIKDKIGYRITKNSLDSMKRKMPFYWTEQIRTSATEYNKYQPNVEPSHQSAIDIAEVTATIAMPPQSWPVFELSPPWEWQLAGCEMFDPLEARDLALLISDPASMEVQWMVPFLESRLDIAQREDKITVSENKLTYIIPTDRRFPIGDPMSLASSVLKPTKAGTLSSVSVMICLKETESFVSEIRSAENALGDYKSDADSIGSNVAQTMEDFVSRFPEIEVTVRPWIARVHKFSEQDENGNETFLDRFAMNEATTATKHVETSVVKLNCS